MRRTSTLAGALLCGGIIALGSLWALGRHAVADSLSADPSGPLRLSTGDLEAFGISRGPGVAETRPATGQDELPKAPLAVAPRATAKAAADEAPRQPRAKPEGRRVVADPAPVPDIARPGLKPLTADALATLVVRRGRPAPTPGPAPLEVTPSVAPADPPPIVPPEVVPPPVVTESPPPAAAQESELALQPPPAPPQQLGNDEMIAIGLRVGVGERGAIEPAGNDGPDGDESAR